jgi:hypothetical protein
VQEFPGGENWCIGRVGQKVSATETGSNKLIPDGPYDSLGALITPSSLYLAELEERLGPAASANIGYADFALTTTPTTQTITAGATANYTVNVTPSNGFNENVDLVAFGLPFGTAVQLQSNTISGGSGSTTLNVSTNASTPRGIYIFAVIGRDGNLYHLATATLTVK